MGKEESFGNRVFERLTKVTMQQLVGGALAILAVIILVVAIRNSPSAVEADVANLPIADCPSDDTGGCVLAVKLPPGLEPMGKWFLAELGHGTLVVKASTAAGDVVFHEAYRMVRRDNGTRLLEIARVDQVDILVLADREGPAGGWKVFMTIPVDRR